MTLLAAVLALGACGGGDGDGDGDDAGATTTTVAAEEAGADAPIGDGPAEEGDDPGTADDPLAAHVELMTEIQRRWDESYTVPSCAEGCDDQQSAVFRDTVLRGVDVGYDLRLLGQDVPIPSGAEELHAATIEASEVLEVIALALSPGVCPVIEPGASCVDDAAAAEPWLETMDGLIDDWVALGD